MTSILQDYRLLSTLPGLAINLNRLVCCRVPRTMADPG
jgi:hypothetical protein